MRLKNSRWSLILTLSTTFYGAPLYADEPLSGKSPQYVWEISKNNLKDPLQWQSIWKSTPQATTPMNNQEWKGSHSETSEVQEKQKMDATDKRKTDWRLNEERRTRNYLQKVGPLQPLVYQSKYAEDTGGPNTTANPSGPIKHYLSQAIVLTTPFISEAEQGGKFYRGECKLRYSASNESNILQLFEEVVIASGNEVGVKPGDLYRTYEVGESYRTFAAGRPLGRLIKTNGIIEILRVGSKSSVGRLIKCFGTISNKARACPFEGAPEVTTTGYTPVSDGKLAAQVVWVTELEQLPQPFSFAIVDRGSSKGFKIGDMVLFFNRVDGHMTDKVLGNGLVVSIKDKSATVLIKDLLPGIINRGDYTIVVQTATM